MSKKEERQIEEKVFRKTAQDEIEKLINPPENKEAPIILTAKERQKAEIARQTEIARRKNAQKLAEKRLMEDEYRGAVASKRNAKARKIANHRRLKNFGWWSCGFWSFILIIAIALGVVFAVIPIRTYLGNNSDKYVKDEIADSTPLQIVQNITTYKAGDVPAIELLLNILLEDYELNKYIAIDVDKINNATLVSSEFTTALTSSIKVIATLRSLGVADDLGDLGNTSAFKNFEKVEEDKLPDFENDDFNAKLYYYKLADGSYARAFDDDGNRIEESNGKDLYLPALVDVMLLDLPAVLPDRLETMRVAELLNSFGMDETNTFTQIIGEERTIGEMKDFDINKVKVSVALPIESNDSLKESLIDMTYYSVLENLAIEKYLADNENKTEADYQALSDADKQLIIDSVIATYPENVDDQYDLITIGDLQNADMDLIKMKSFIKLPDKSDDNYERVSRIYKIILDATYEGEYDESNYEEFNDICDSVTLKALSNMDTDKIRIVTVLDEDSNKDIFNILRDMTYAETNDQMRVGDLARTDITHIRLYNVLPIDRNERVYDVLLDISYENVMEQLIIDQMIKEKMDAEELYDADHNWKDYYSWDYATKASATQSMRQVYEELSGTDQEEKRQAQEDYYNGLTKRERQNLITVASLDKASVNDLKLSSVVTDDSTNKILNKLVEKETTVGNLPTAINDLTIAELYGDNVFTKDVSKAVVFADKKVARYSYDESTGIYTNEEVLEGVESSTSLPSAPGNYYISKDASIWLFLLYDAQDTNGDEEGGVYDDNGFVKMYKSNGKTLGTIDNSISGMNSVIQGATVRQLVVAGILENNEYSSKMYKSTMSSLLSDSLLSVS